MKATFGKFLILIGLATYISINGCTAGWWESRYKRDLYEELNLYDVKTIAVFPLINIQLDSNENREVNQYLIAGLEKIMQKYILLDPEQCMKILNRDSLKGIYNYDISSICSASKKKIKGFGKRINCDAILLSEISQINISNDSDQNKIINSCNVDYVLYSAEYGDVIWGNSVNPYIETDTASDPVPLISLVRIGIDLLFLKTNR